MPDGTKIGGIAGGLNRRGALAVALAGASVFAAQWARAQMPDPTGPQPELAKERLVIVTRDGQQHVFNVEMAISPDQQTTGLMFRREVPADGGMLFDWGAARESDMWMRNTISSLDMLFINADGTIRHIAEHTVPRSLATIASGGPVRATLEVAAGTAERLNIRVGDKVLQRIFGNAGTNAG
jgi:uncharacterized membrane protein (UPF0127 family)